MLSISTAFLTLEFVEVRSPPLTAAPKLVPDHAVNGSLLLEQTAIAQDLTRHGK